MTVTRTSSPRAPSTTLPKMILASGWTASRTSSAALLISNRPRSEPPWKNSKTPWAPSMEVSSSGEAMACSVAVRARSSPVAEPMPMRALPASCITDFTSLKSTLINPGVVMSSVMPWTPWRRTWSACLKASTTEILRSAIWRRRSLGMTIRVSTSSRRLATPLSAWLARRRPSKAKGRVTTPMVRAPSSRATWATTGAAPVPVPPPSPAVTKTMSAPSRDSRMSSWWSSAALRPMLGSAPAPRPRVRSRPMSSLVSASDMRRA